MLRMLTAVAAQSARGCAFFALASTVSARADVAADEPSGYYAALSVAADDADFSRVGGEIAVPLGRNTWLELNVGAIEGSSRTEDGDATFAGLTLGSSAGLLSFDVEYMYREDGFEYTQHDMEGGFTYAASYGSIGLDLFYRHADQETVASIERRVRDPLAITVNATSKGVGIGTHGDLILSEHLTLFGSAMIYDYDSSSSLPPRLGRFAKIALSRVTRDEAYLRDTINVGVTYGFSLVSLSAAYYRDRVFEGGEVTDTGELAADFPLGERWMLVAWIGHSVTEQESGLTYGGARISVIW